MLQPLSPLLRTLVIRSLLAREWWQSRVTYNPLSPGVYLDPYPKYAQLRAQDPIHWSPLLRSWVFARYEHVDAILRDHQRFSSDPRKRIPPPPRPPVDTTFLDQPSMLFLDPPDHTRLRALVSRVFTPRRIEALQPHIREVAHGLLGEVRDASAFDMIESLAYPLPVIVIAEMLGVPPEDRSRFKTWSHWVARTLEPTITPREFHLAVEAAGELDGYFRGIVAQRRAEPRDDVISALIAAEDQGDQLSEDELLVMLRLLLVAGNETTTNLIGNGLLALLRHPDQLERLRDNPDLAESAVEELLRYDGPVQLDGRGALEDVAFDGRLVRRGQNAILLIGSANRDAAVFRDPDRLDLGRQEASNISFGRGIHHCLGAPLARVEGRIAFQALLERFAEIRLAGPPPRFKDNVVLRGLRSLPVSARRN